MNLTNPKRQGFNELDTTFWIILDGHIRKIEVKCLAVSDNTSGILENMNISSLNCFAIIQDVKDTVGSFGQCKFQRPQVKRNFHL